MYQFLSTLPFIVDDEMAGQNAFFFLVRFFYRIQQTCESIMIGELIGLEFISLWDFILFGGIIFLILKVYTGVLGSLPRGGSGGFHSSSGGDKK